MFWDNLASLLFVHGQSVGITIENVKVFEIIQIDTKMCP